MQVQTTLIKDTIDLYQGDTLVKSVPFTFNASKCLQDVQHLRAEMIANKAADDMEGVGGRGAGRAARLVRRRFFNRLKRPGADLNRRCVPDR